MAVPRASVIRGVLGSPRFSQALTEAMLITAVTAAVLRALLGWSGYLAIVVGLVALGLASLTAQPERIEWRGTLPISLIGLFSVMAVSTLWSAYPGATVQGVAYALCFGVMGVYIALVRDGIQLVRSVGNVLRGVLTVGIALEILSGILLDAPISFLGIAGNLAVGGPIQGIAGTRNSLAFVAALAIITFWIEYRTRSVSSGVATYGLALACLSLLFARSPVSWFVLAAVLTAGLILVVVRRQPARARRRTQAALLITAVVGIAFGWAFRGRLVGIADAAIDVQSRTSVWAQIQDLVEPRVLEGFGWVGPWRPELFPFAAVRDAFGERPPSALNAYVDTVLQLGVIGAVVLGGVLALAVVRAWLVASQRKSTVYVWPALVLVLLITTSITESYLLFELGLMLLVLSVMAASRNRSWRQLLAPRDG
ncbi:exopolysaccharide production protein [Microcella alkaliphila]|uniref:exopolysaccharide production protein n=1 Tax=Microcella alkaliphila TaxID=279828 RepID=UPI001237887E|nr:exopolysaccharide production protein [Microcella alkaliphila]